MRTKAIFVLVDIIDQAAFAVTAADEASWVAIGVGEMVGAWMVATKGSTEEFSGAKTVSSADTTATAKATASTPTQIEINILKGVMINEFVFRLFYFHNI